MNSSALSVQDLIGGRFLVVKGDVAILELEDAVIANGQAKDVRRQSHREEAEPAEAAAGEPIQPVEQGADRSAKEFVEGGDVYARKRDITTDPVDRQRAQRK